MNIRDTIRDAIAGKKLPGGEQKFEENVSLALCAYYEDHPARPEGDILADLEESGWTPWVLEKQNEALERIVDAVIDALQKEDCE